jgi:prepilin-type N-terminal cleavage/methylation domain-containing protein
MSPSGSDIRPAKPAPILGFTLVEVMIALVIATVLGTALIRFYKDSYKTYSTQEQITQRDQNAHFTVTRLAETLQQAGSVLPDTGWTVLRQSGGILIVGLNPRGAEQFNGQNAGPTQFIPVGDATLFANTANVMLNTTHVLLDYANPARATARLSIDAGYNSGGFVKGVKNNPSGLDSIRVTTAVTLSVGDRIFAYREDHYLLSGGNLVVRPNGDAAQQMVLAEGIDSLGVTFRTATGAATTNWKLMRSASLTVRARTEKPDPKLPPPGYRKITLPMNVILRNRI